MATHVITDGAHYVIPEKCELLQLVRLGRSRIKLETIEGRDVGNMPRDVAKPISD